MQRYNHLETPFGIAPGHAGDEFAATFGPEDDRHLQVCGRFEGEHAVAACDGVIDLLAVFFNVSGRQLRSAGRTALPVARIRQIGMYIAHVTLGMKMAAVGAGFGRDKSTG
ncbi:MAG: hypothetical protein Kow0026_22990 [Oricola sp.]